MELDSYYKASADFVNRDAELSSTRYRTKDGEYVISGSDLRLMSMRGHILADEYVTGLPVTKITEEKSRLLISEGGYLLGSSITPENPEEENQEMEEPSGELADNDEHDNNE